MKRTIIVIPSLEPDQKMLKLLADIRTRDTETPILIVNDGSAPSYDPIFEEAEQVYHCIVLKHEVNRGKGAALKTAARYIVDNLSKIRYMVTIDSDGQHTYEDMMNCISKAYREGDVMVLGTRNFDKDVPLRSKFGNVLTRNILRMTTGINVTDTQTGLRVIPRSFMETMLTIAGDRFEYETNMLIEAKQQKLPIVSQDIETIYIEENASSHFHVIKDSLRIYSVFFKYLLSSGGCFLVDFAIFTGLMLMWQHDVGMIMYATIIARICSSLLNYFINRNLVFYGTSRASIIKYFVLVGVQMLASGFLVATLATAFPHVGQPLLKVFVDVGLFVVSYHIQKRYVF